MTQKVVAYITDGPRLLVFRHPDAPEAGIQVPAGTVEPGESLEEAVLREAAEETGLPGLRLARALGEQVFDLAGFGRDEIQQRHFYHLCCTVPPSAAWQHWEATPADGSPPIRFAFFWAALPDGVPALIAGQGAMLPELRAALELPPAVPSPPAPGDS